jgi:hypothetical protein
MSAGAKGPSIFKGPPGFGQVQLKLLARLLNFARELTGDYYKLGQAEAGSIPIEVGTLADLQQFEIHSGEVLAYIARYGYADPRFGRKRDLYQVNLQDHNILQSLERTEDGLVFSPLMLYVLTHELIHVIRFVKFLTPFHQSEAQRVNEEQRVHSLTHKILSRVPVEGMDRVLSKYEKLAT